jgi:uncharacterized protein with ParB-like and HNH nuclease domain
VIWVEFHKKFEEIKLLKSKIIEINNHMKANELPINTFLQNQNVQFVIPVYQRNYDWSPNECRDLINDIIAVEQENRGTHFIGSIVFIHEGVYSTSEVRELVIIDGQQRLTTITILYVALYRYAKENGLLSESEMLYDMFLINKYVHNEASKLKLKQTDNNSKAFKAIMLGTEKEFDAYSNVIENYNYFKSRINSEEDFQNVKNGLKRLIFVEISLERDKDDPQRIFESLNSTGLDLSQSDLIRNFILMDLEPLEQNRVFENVWNPIEENARDLKRQQSLVSDYIRDYLTLKNKKIPNKSAVYAEFKRLYTNKKDQGFQQELENIKALSIHYKKLINPHTISDLNLRKELIYISRLEINVAFPFLLQVFEDAENGIIENTTLINILKLLQTYVWRRFVVGLPTSALNKIFMTLYAEIDHEDYYNSLAIALLRKKSSAKFPTNEEIHSALLEKDLYNIQSKNRNYLFELLENHNNREHVDTSNPSITIEHIFPQNPSDTWKEDLDQETYYWFKDKKINTLANLTLSGNNGLLSNKSFLEKKTMNKENGEQGYAFSRLWLNVFLNQLHEWNEENYMKRFNLIYDRFISIWNYPDIQLPVNEDSSEQNIFDAESPRYKKLAYFIFENTKIEEEVVAQMYFYVITKLFEKNPTLLLFNEEGLKITRNSSDFRVAQTLTNGYFIESNIDSPSKFSMIKRLLILFNMEDDLLIKYDEGEGNAPNRFVVRKKFWSYLLPKLNEVCDTYKSVSPNNDSWLSAGAGISGFTYICAATKTGVRVELDISTSSKERNKQLFKQFENNKERIEARFGDSFSWQELPDYKLSVVSKTLPGLNIYDESNWQAMYDFFCEYMPRLVNAFSEEINGLKEN